MKSYLALPAISLLLFSSLPSSRGADEIVIEHTMELFPQPIPVSISGFSGEVDAIFKSDIIFLGMKDVAPAEAKYLITGSNSGRVEGRLVRKIDNQQMFARAYTGSSQRLSTHALADAI